MYTGLTLFIMLTLDRHSLAFTIKTDNRMEDRVHTITTKV